MKNSFGIGKLGDGRWAITNLEQVDLTEQDIKDIYSIVLTWLQIRMQLVTGGGENNDTDTDEAKN